MWASLNCFDDSVLNYIIIYIIYNNFLSTF